MEKQKLIYVESKALFSPSEVSDKAIVFIKDTKEIWTHGVYFSCSGTWATPITLSLTGDTTGSVSIDGSGNASIATTTTYLSGTTGIADANNAANTQSQKIAYYPRIGSSASNLFAVGNNANAILSLNVHDYDYTHLLGFSSDGNIYHRRRNGGTWETSWKTILSSSNYTNFHHTFASLTNKPTTLSGYGITDCIPIIKGGTVTTDTDLSTLGMTTSGVKFSISCTTTAYPFGLHAYSNFLMFRAASDTYSGIATDAFNGYVTFVGGRNLETTANNVPNWWFKIKGNSETTYDLNSILTTINNLGSTYLPLTGGTLTDTLVLKAGAFTASNGNSYSGGRYQAVAKPNIRLIGDSAYGLSTIEFISLKGDTSINKPSDSGFIQFQPYGVSALSSVGSHPTLKTSGETNALVLGVTNDSDDIIVLQSPNVSGLRHACGTTEYYLPHVTTSTTTANKPLVSTTTAHVYTLGAECLPLSGGTMTGKITLWSSNADAANTGGLNANNSNIYGLNSLYFADASETAAEGINFYRSSTTVDSLWGSNGNLYWTPNRTYGSAGTSYYVLTSNNYSTHLNNTYLPLSGGIMIGLILMTRGSSYLTDTGSGYSMLGMINSGTSTTGMNSEEGMFINVPFTLATLRTSGDNLYHYNHSKSTRYLILDTNNYSTYALPLSGGTMKGALNFANNTWNKVGDDAYMGDCDVAGMIGIKGSNAATPGFAMYNDGGTLLGKLYASGSDLYWSGVKLLTSTGSAKEAYLEWGGQNLHSSSSPIDAALAPALGANRLAFLNPNAIDIEYSRDGGTTWIDYGASDASKATLFITNRSYPLIYLGKDSTLDTSIDRTSWRLRITISAIGYSLYCKFLKFMIFVTDYGNALRCALLGRTYSNVQNDVDTWVTFLDTSLGGWSGWNTINYPAGITIPHTGHYGQIRFDFYITRLGTSGYASSIQKILGFAHASWLQPSNMAAFGDIYNYDWQQNVTFPAQVTATGGFSGNLTGNVTGNVTGNADTASKWKTARTITLTGDVTGSVSLDGSSNVTLTTSTSGSGTSTFLKCVDKRNSYPALIVTSGGNIGASFMSASKLGLSDGDYYDALILRGYVDNSGGQENALLFSKNSSSVYHSQYAFGSTTTWGTMYKFLDSGNYSSYALPLSGGTMTGNIILTTGKWIADSTTSTSILGTFASGNSTEGLYSEAGVLVGKTATQTTLSSNGDDLWHYRNSDKKRYKILDAANYTNYTIPYSKVNVTNGALGAFIYNGNLLHNNNFKYLTFFPSDNLGNASYVLIAKIDNWANTANATSHISYGINGLFIAYRSGNMANTGSYFVTNVAYVNTNYKNYKLYLSEARSYLLVPLLVIYLDEYYLAFKKDGSSTDYHFYGQVFNILPSFIYINDTSLITLASGPFETVTTGLYYYNNGNGVKKFLHEGNYSNYALPLSGGTLGNTSATETELRLKSSTTTLRLIAHSSTTFNYIQSGNADFNGSTPLQITGYNGTVGSDLYLKFNNIYCRSGNYTNIDSGNYGNYALKVDGTNGTADGVSTLLNKLTTGTATPVDADYYICQYAGGGTTTTTYVRRPVSALYTYIKSKIALDFLPLSGGTLTGKLTMKANSIDNLPLIYRTDAAYISGIRFLNTLGYLGAIGMNAVSGSLYILDTANTTYTILDSRNYNNYSPTLTGTGASGTWAINISGVAASASKVANALTIQLNGGTTAGTNKFVYDGSSAYTINITPEAIGASATSHTHSYLPLSGGTLGSTAANITELSVLSSTAKLQLLAYSDTTNYIESGNSDFTGNATLKITGYSSNTGSNLYFNFANIYCRAGNYTNIDSGNYSTYALPLSGGTLTGTLISRDIRPSANLSYSLGTSSYYYNYVYANYFKKNGSSDSYVLLGGGGHKAVSDFAPNNVATLSSSGMGNSDLWTLVFEKSYPANYWYAPTTMFYIRSASAGCGILCFYNYWESGTQLNDYEREVWFFGASKSETGTAFGGANRDINDYFRIYIDKANFKYCMYYNRYNDLSLKILELLFFTVPEPGEYISTGALRSSFFTNSTTVVDLPTESSTLVRVPIKTTYNHDRTIKTTKSIYASSFYENSDIRLKENVRGIDLSDLTKLVDLVLFNFKDSGTKKYGVIALLLELVGLQNLVYENNGNKAVDYISLLVLEIQRLRNEIGELKLEINKKS